MRVHECGVARDTPLRVWANVHVCVCVCAGECVWRMRVHERVYVRERMWGDGAIVVCVCVGASVLCVQVSVRVSEIGGNGR